MFAIAPFYQVEVTHFSNLDASRDSASVTASAFNADSRLVNVTSFPRP
jgi:hypothetical protein